MTHSFSRPVSIVLEDGRSFVLSNIPAAIEFLESMQEQEHQDAHDAALVTCQNVLIGLESIDDAYDVLCAFARRLGVLKEDKVLLAVPEEIEPRLVA